MTLPSFADKFNISGAVISAVDLIKGLGISAGMRSIDVEGATGNLHTNYEGKANAATQAFESGVELVYLHLEGPDEHGHRGEAENKKLCIENIDKRVLRPVFDYLQNCGEDFGIMILPDHPTPVRLRTHTRAPVPYLIYSSRNKTDGINCYTEEGCADGEYIADGWKLMQHFIDICNR
jgi:2,3-bisphosphoglycerate-independent phosphoglycerate mutase